MRICRCAPCCHFVPTTLTVSPRSRTEGCQGNTRETKCSRFVPVTLTVFPTGTRGTRNLYILFFLFPMEFLHGNLSRCSERIIRFYMCSRIRFLRVFCLCVPCCQLSLDPSLESVYKE
jgi:hypothetical protein